MKSFSILFLCNISFLLAIPLRTSISTENKYILSSNNVNQKKQTILGSKSRTDFPTLVKIRGGGSDDEDDDDLVTTDDSSSSDSIVLIKLRNTIRSMIKIGNKKSPTLTKALTTLLKKIENTFGVSLLPVKKKSKKKKKKAPKKKSTATEEEEELKEEKQKKKEKKQQKTTAATKQHLTKTISSKNPNYRIQRELKEFIKSPPANLSVKVGSNIRIWIVNMVGAENSIYEGEKFKLRIEFPKDYPTVPPSVYFLQPTPQHEHVYTNGDICLSLLGKDWRPTMTAQSIALSILTILSSAQHKQLPMDNARHALNKPGQYQKDWVYHDDNC